MLPDGTYDILVVDATAGEAGTLYLDLAILGGDHKGELVSIRAEGLGVDALDAMGLPGTLTVRDGEPPWHSSPGGAEPIGEVTRQHRRRLQPLLAVPCGLAPNAAGEPDGRQRHNEPSGNQDVWHYHLHVLPRWHGDDLYRLQGSLAPAEEIRARADQLRRAWPAST